MLFLLFVALWGVNGLLRPVGPAQGRLSARVRALASEEVDVIVIGSGIGGLSCAGLLAAKGRKVTVLEAHYELGGCAHEFAVGLDGRTVPSQRLLALGSEAPPVFRFEAGPSLYSGLSPANSPNPLKHVYQMVGEEPEWITYGLWGAHLPEAPEGYELSIGAENFLKILETYGGPTAVPDWEKLAEKLRPLAKGVMGLPSTAVRDDPGIFLTLGLRYPLPFLRVLRDVGEILKPFDMDDPSSPYYVEDAFLRNYLDLIAFLLQGLPANQTLTAVIAYMIEDFYREGAVMDFPKGGSGGLIDALARGVLKRPGCTIRRSTAVESVVVENGKAVGVKLANGEVVRAKAVVSNADLFNTFKFVDEGAHAGFDAEREAYLAPPTDGGVPLCRSFVHVHLGIELDDETASRLPPQWTVVSSWDDVTAAGNVVVVSVPSLLDRAMAPKGMHTIHAYCAGSEPFDVWEKYKGDAQNPEYLALKKQRAQPCFDAILKRIPDLAQRTVVEQIGTPLTHERFLKRHRGNYGLAIPAGTKGLAFPKVTTPLPGYYRCGDSTTAGIGVPAVASSGAQCANALLSVWEQLELNSKIIM
ncbi:hypothetical protein M885DRAFT_461295 [Pelagophyceae sp. CCMP2097]|nr:hypothetical protein M885DRAFT_461295 [Pelagophyceae sp. CCMP2097]|mmetsp:Transcript_23761/g.81157  ORF Transcript_23761/g.81157 Transcript_23761/m.81157 type:complete len:585 (+) Transcript_23761:80-1834(+)